jgi:DNA-3-methyladenine glycosylase I
MSSKVLSDGIRRCSWLTENPLYVRYHDKEWGTVTTNQRDLFESICLEGFQAGLSWLTILKRREDFRKAFDNFDSKKIAEYGKREVNRLRSDESIIRNLAKINSAINNARVVEKHNINLPELLWSFAPRKRITPRSGFSWQATSSESEAMSKELKRMGFSFVGSTSMYALMQSSGMIFDHAPGCFRKA